MSLLAAAGDGRMDLCGIAHTHFNLEISHRLYIACYFFRWLIYAGTLIDM
jgi:hypothetical protein